MQGFTRRYFMLGTAGLLAMPSTTALAKLLDPTPAQTAGPFYPDELPFDDDNDLTRVQGRNNSARGTITDLTGRLLDINGKPLAAVRIEIWQCDANGRYHHPRDSRNQPMDGNFQGHGRVLSDAQGRYRFRTIRPVPYPGRTPHIHVAVFPDGIDPFVTQLYVADEPRNADDFIFTRLPPDRRHLVVTQFRHISGGEAEVAAEWDMVLGETPYG
jgi:protocatechuate 3,4-dioxygenase beta subunit